MTHRWLHGEPVAFAVFWATLLAAIVFEVRNGTRNVEGARQEMDADSYTWLRRALIFSWVATYCAAQVRATAFPGSAVPYVYAGCAIACVGIAIRQWAVHTLGRFFTFTVSVHEGQTVVTDGPYRFARHPSYTGATLTRLGIGLALANWLALAAITVLPFIAIVNRIRVEERALSDALGDPYRSFCATRKRLVPGIW